MPNNISHWLSAEEIKERLDLFHETNDYSVFDDVPEEQSFAVLYPHRMERLNIIPDNINTDENLT